MHWENAFLTFRNKEAITEKCVDGEGVVSAVQWNEHHQQVMVTGVESL